MEDEDDEIFYEDSFNLNMIQIPKSVYFSSDTLKHMAQGFEFIEQ